MGLNLDKIRTLRDKAVEEANRRSAKFYEWKAKRNRLRILPPWAGADDFSRIFAKHWHLGPEGKTIVYCPKICFDQPCPICDSIERMWKTKPDDPTKEWLKSVGAAPRFYVNVIDLDDLDSGIQIAEFPKTVLMEIWNIMVDKEVGVGDITHLEKGRNMIIDKTGSGIGTRYAVRAELGATPVPIPIEAADLPNLDMLVRTESYENLKLVWEGKEPISGPGLPAPAASPGVAALPPPIETVKVGGTHVVTPPPIDPAADLEAKAAAAAAAVSEGRAPVVAAPAPSTPSIPACFGGFDEKNAKCLDCTEQDDCELKMLEAKRAARKAAASSAPAAAPVTAAPAATPAAGISVTDLMAEMEAAINR